MKIKKIFFLILFIFIFITSLFVNIHVTKSTNVLSLDIFDIDGIYFDLSLMDDKTKANEINGFINSKNVAFFGSAIHQKENPIGQFYAFCGYLKTSQEKAGRFLDTLLLDKQKVMLYLDKDTILKDYPAGYAYLKLIKDFPEELAQKPGPDFYTNIESTLFKAYKSKLAEENSDYKRLLLKLIAEKNPGILSDVVKDFFAGKSISGMNEDEKIELSFLIYSLNDIERGKVTKAFLKENNEKILINTLNSIKENDPKELGDAIKAVLIRSKSPDVLTVGIEKYGELLKKDAIETIALIIKDSDNVNVIKSGLNKISRYGDDSNYDLLKLFLALRYPEEINLVALDAIIKTTYKTKPDDVLNTMAFILRKGKESIAFAAVKFFIDKNLYQNSGLVLYRLKQRESKEMDKLALEYIDFFKLTESGSLLRNLAQSNDPEIKDKAVKLMQKLNISSVATDADEEETIIE